MKAIPNEFLNKINFSNEIITRSFPGVKLTKKHDEHNGHCHCNARHEFGNCLSGLTGFNQSKGIEMWENRDHNYDICLKCARVDRLMEIVINQEEDLIWDIIGITKEKPADEESKTDNRSREELIEENK